jgi:hypothetical protein
MRKGPQFAEKGPARSSRAGKAPTVDGNQRDPGAPGLLGIGRSCGRGLNVTATPPDGGARLSPAAWATTLTILRKDGRQVEDRSGMRNMQAANELKSSSRKVTEALSAAVVTAADDVPFRAESGKFVVLLGATRGCWPVHLLRLIAGLEGT